MSRARRHHIVPRTLLWRFADSQKELRAVPRNGDDPFIAGIQNLAVEKDFYAVETEEGPGVLEGLFAKIEGDATHAIDRLGSGELPSPGEEREALAYFIALQWLRGRDFRDSWQSAQQEFSEHLKQALSNASRSQHRAMASKQLGRPATDLEVDALGRYLRDRTVPVEMDNFQNAWAGAMLSEVKNLANSALNRKWILLRAKEPSLLTSDSPVVLSSARLWPITFASADEVRLSVDRQHVLVLVDASLCGEFVAGATDDFIIDQNIRTARNGYRHYFQHPTETVLPNASLPPSRARFTRVTPS